MKPLTKTTVNRGGGIAARFAAVEPKPAKPKVANKPVSNVANPKPKDRVTRWREANPELYLERQRAYAKRYRAKLKEAKE